MAIDVLADILADRRSDLAAAKGERPLPALESRAKASIPRDFFGAVTRPDRIAIIAETKRQSPSAGVLRDPYVPAEIARDYAAGGAAAISVLTEPRRFGGAIEHLTRVREAASLPVLRKDFVFDPYQIVEARAFGADAVLLIADMLDPRALAELAAAAREWRIEPLVEIFTADVLRPALDSGARLIGVNSRDLRTLEMKPDNVTRLAKTIPKDRFVVAESGLKTAADVAALKSIRVSAALVGESLLRRPDLQNAVRGLVEAGRR